MPNRLRTMQIPSKMPPLQHKISRYNNIPAPARPHHRTIIPNPHHHPTPPPARKLLPYLLDEA